MEGGATASRRGTREEVRCFYITVWTKAAPSRMGKKRGTQ